MTTREALERISALIASARGAVEQGIYTGDANAIRTWGELSAAQYAIETLLGAVVRAGLGDVELEDKK